MNYRHLLLFEFKISSNIFEDVFKSIIFKSFEQELEIKDTTESTTSASYLDLLLPIGRDGQLHTSIYDKRDDF